MKQFLIFESLTQAQQANDLITEQMAAQFDDNTVQWAEPLQRLDGLYCFAKPIDEFMTGVEYSQIETYDRGWFDVESANV